MATAASICCTTALSGAAVAASRSRQLSTSQFALGSSFLGSQPVTVQPTWEPKSLTTVYRNCFATVAAVDTGVKQYTLPTWADFEMGYSSVYWETATGRPPCAGELITIYFNPSSSKLIPNEAYGIAFNGGFNQPIMCGGEPRVMTRKDRGIKCSPFYTIKINVPLHALTLEFSFTDGKEWNGPYKIEFKVYSKFKNMPTTFFTEGLTKELSQDGACENAIYPDAVFVKDRCEFPAGLIHDGGNRCDLDIVPGCTDPNSPYFNPLANVDDGSCPYFSDSE